MNFPVLILALLVTGGSVLAEPRTPESPQAPPFAQWLNQLRAEAQAAGISVETLDGALGDVAPVERVMELDRNQPEVRLEFWTYLDRIASGQRIEAGRRLLEEK